MHILLLALGILATAAGVAMVGFGIPINDFSFGNTLIVAGTIAIVGGFLLIGVAAACRQLRRIADAVSVRPAARPSAAVEPQAATVRPAPVPGGRVPFPAPRSESPDREPRLAAAPSIDAPEPLEWLRPKSEPRAAPTTEPSSTTAKTSEAASKFRLPNQTETAVDRALKSENVRAASPTERPSRGLFDSVWPATDRKPVTAPTSEVENRTGRKETAIEDRRSGDASPPERRVAAVLKSGVIDGMGYTLYTDGSIEAELPQGTVRFDSINDLRAHLEASVRSGN